MISCALTACQFDERFSGWCKTIHSRRTTADLEEKQQKAHTIYVYLLSNWMKIDWYGNQHHSRWYEQKNVLFIRQLEMSFANIERSFYVTKGAKSTWIPIKGNMFDLWACVCVFFFRVRCIVVHIAVDTSTFIAHLHHVQFVIWMSPQMPSIPHDTKAQHN